MAATILVGKQIGAGNIDEAKTYARLSVILSFIAMNILGLVLFFFGEWAGGFFTDDQEVIGNIGLL